MGKVASCHELSCPDRTPTRGSLRLSKDSASTGPSHAGRQGRPGPPHFFGQFYIFYIFDFIEITENTY